MHNPFTRLTLWFAYKAGLLTWAQLPLTTQVAFIKAGATASPWPGATAANAAATQRAIANQQAALAASGNYTAWYAALPGSMPQGYAGHLTGYVPTVATAPSTQTATAAYRKVR